jgi:hypothetical protein
MEKANKILNERRKHGDRKEEIKMRMEEIVISIISIINPYISVLEGY